MLSYSDSHVGCSLVVLIHVVMYIVIKRGHYKILHVSKFRKSVRLFKTKIWNWIVGKKKNPLLILFKGWKVKSVSQITVCHHLTSLVMPKGDPQDGVFYSTLSLITDSYKPAT